MSNLESELYRLFSPPPQPAVEFICWLAQQYQLDEPLALLDVGIGTGQALPLYQQRKWRVVGYEPNETFLERARESVRSAEKNPHPTLKKGGFLQVEECGEFDIAVAINAPFAYLEDETERREALQRIHHALRPDGVFLLEVPNILWFLRHKSECEVEEKPFGNQQARYSCRYEFDFHKAIMTMYNEYIVMQENQVTQRVCTQDRLSILKQSEIVRELTESNFADVRVFSSLEARETGRADGAQIIISARKQSP